MDGVNKTLYIPLYGKALVSRKGILLHDPKAEEIWEKEGFSLKGKSASKWLAYYMAMRSWVFDEWTRQKMEANPDSTVLHLGCGLDSRYERIKMEAQHWFDVDYPEVIRERSQYYAETPHYHMVAADVTEEGWIHRIPGGGNAIVAMEGISMYLRPQELQRLLKVLGNHFSSVCLLMDCYSGFAARASKYKNPVNDVGVTEVYGMDDPQLLAEKTGFTYLREHDMTPLQLISRLDAGERIVFANLYGGKLARSLYRLYEFEQK